MGVVARRRSRSSVAEIGYSLIVGARGKGYAAEAVRAIVEVAFDDGEMARIDACCVPENLASRRVLQHIGFIATQIQPNGAVVRGRPVDVCLYALSRHEWEGLRYGRVAAARACYGSSANWIVICASSNA